MSIFVPTFQTGAAARKAEPFLAAIPHLGASYWWRADRGTTLVNTDEVSVFTDIIAAGLMQAGTTGARPRLVANLIGGYSGLSFDGTNDNTVISPITGPGPLSSAFTIAIVMQVNAVPGSTVYALSNFSGVSVGTMLAPRADGKIRFHHGNGYMEGTMIIGAPMVVLISFKSGFIRGRINSVDMLSTTGTKMQASDGNSGGATLTAGAINNTGATAAAFSMTDLMFFPRDIITDGPTLRQVEEYAAVRYGAALTTY